MLFKKINIVFCLCLLTIGLFAQTTTFSVDAGPYRKICPGTVTTIGGNPTASGGSGNYQYIWRPGKSLYDSTSANPIASPSVTTTYTVFVTDHSSTGGPKSDTVTVYVYPYSINAGHDTTIKQGQTITLHGQAPGNSVVWWNPQHGSLFNENSLNPDFYSQTLGNDSVLLIANFPHGCVLYDHVVIKVTPSTELVFYNSFSPNGDGSNDSFVIGNLNLYPNNTLEIYNRYGQKVLSKNPYDNDWNGTYLGTELPCGTYFYILDTHDDKGGKHKGEVN
ncbi:MAG TPA: gliding motility-associated C-terminal domain-containing protein, partial [Bacteroidia bacterium]|nr:gliding motility-associated C-terminal domain-containing protein [Bacteroidia bacterium]